MTPVALRKEAREERRKGKKQQAVKRWNPATYFILIFMLIGSFGIHFINLRQSYALESRRAENRIAMLQEVLRRVQAGEDVDVEKMLGTGDPLAEQEWEEVIKHIQEEDRLWQSKEKKRARKQARKEAREAAEAAIEADNSPKASDHMAKDTNGFGGHDGHSSKKGRTPGFY